MQPDLVVDETQPSASDVRPISTLPIVLVAAFLGFSLAGVLLAVVGWFWWWTFLLLGGAVAGALVWSLGGRFEWPRRPSNESLLAGAVVAVIIGAVLAQGVVFSSEHIITNRDPGVYFSTGKWLAEHGTLLVDGATGGFADIDGVVGWSQGTYQGRPDGLLYPQFMHLTGMWLAVGNWVGGDATMFRTPAVLAALSMIAFWLFARLFLRPWYAAGAVGALSATLVVIHFSRDAYSEFLMVGFFFAGLWLLDVARRAEWPRLAFLAGLVFGATAIARLDALVAIIPFVAYLVGVEWRAIADGDGDVGRRFTKPVLRGVFVALFVAYVDLLLRSPDYLSGRRRVVLPLLFAFALVLAVGMIGSFRGGIARSVVAKAREHRRSLAVALAVGIGGFAAYAYFIRPLAPGHNPSVNIVTEWTQELRGLEVDGTRSYWELSFRWLTWQIGVPAMTIAVAGWALAVKKAVRGEWVRLAAFLAAFSALTVGYVLKPSVQPDQMWAMRRFLTVTWPGLFFLAFLVVQFIIDRWAPDGWRRVAAATAAVVLLIGVPASFSWPLRSSTAYRGVYAATGDLCETLPPGSAVLIDSEWGHLVYPYPLRAFCGLHVASIHPQAEDRDSAVKTAAAAWQERGVPFFVMSDAAADGMVPAYVLDVDFTLPELTLTRRPFGLDTRNIHFEVSAP